jgi:hypothetical protein
MHALWTWLFFSSAMAARKDCGTSVVILPQFIPEILPMNSW